jgi:hypothetical protein
VTGGGVEGWRPDAEMEVDLCKKKKKASNAGSKAGASGRANNEDRNEKARGSGQEQATIDGTGVLVGDRRRKEVEKRLWRGV